MSSGLLSHLKVLDLSQYVAGSYATRLMAGFGAKVIKVEQPEVGSALRHRGPFYQNQPGLERSLLFHWLSGDKQSVTLNLEQARSLELLQPLIAEADILVEDFAPGVIEQLNLGYKALQQINPRLVMVSISNFGQSGPRKHWKATEIVLYAMSGGMSLSGDQGRPPLNTGTLISQYTAGMHAYLAALLAYHRCQQDGQGEWIDVSIQESALENVEVKLAEALQLNQAASRNGDQHILVPWECCPAQDGYVAVVGGPMRQWQSGATMFNQPDLLQPPLNTITGRIAHRHEIQSRLRALLATQLKERFIIRASGRIGLWLLGDTG
ncbi:MAG: CoA transferase [Phormidesmis sp. RL_2_1]|nr:CoA transferase [Phormidesmis sp. RL_2_1]